MAGLKFDPRNTTGALGDKQTVPTVVDDYFNPSSIEVPQWNPTRLKQATDFVNWSINTPVEDQKEVFGATTALDRWDKGLEGLGEEERDLWNRKYESILQGYTPEERDRVWRNQQYANTFGKEDFYNTPNYEDRDRKYENYLTLQAAYNKFGGNKNFNEIVELTSEGRRELLSSDYKSDIALEFDKDQIKKDKSWADHSLKERAVSLWEGVKSGALEWGATGSVIGGLFGGGIGLVPGIIVGTAGGALAGAASGLVHPEDAKDIIDKDKEADNNEILHKISVADNERKKELASAQADQTYNKLLQDYEAGRYTDAEINHWFDDIALNKKKSKKDVFGNVSTEDYNGSNYYSAFKHSDEFEHFGTTDKLRQIAQFDAVARQFGEASAMQVLDQDMQNYVNKHQTGLQWLGNTGQNIIVGGVANLANNVVGLGALASYLRYGEEGLSNYLEGRDAEGKEDNAFLLNPQYWNKVDQYNTFDREAIAKADRNGGVSRWNNVVEAGTEGDFWTWNTANEALRMSKFAWSDLLKNMALGKLTRVATRVAGGIELAPGVLASESPLSAQVINKLGAYGTMGASSLGIDVAYGMQTYNDILDENKQKVDKVIQQDVEEELKQRLNTPQSKEEFKQLVAAENARRAEAARMEGVTSVALNEEQAYEAYVNHLRQQILEEQEQKHAEDRQEARNDAAFGYVLDATIEAIRMAPTNGLFKSYLFDKGTLAAIGANNPFVQTTFKNGAYDLGKHAIAKRAAAQMATQMWGGFQSNYFDDVTVGFAKGFGIQDYNNYLYQKYNPAVYGAVLDDYVSPIVAAMTGVRESMVDKRSFIDGGVGALGTPVSIAPNVAGAISHTERMKELAESIEDSEKKGIKSKGIHWSEHVSDFINNPILQAIADAHASARATEREIFRANERLKENGHSLDNMGETISVLNQKAATRAGTSVLDAEDAKDKEVFTLATALIDLKNSGAEINAQVEPDKANWSMKKKASNAIIEGLNALMGIPFFSSSESSYAHAMQVLEDASTIDRQTSDEQTAARQEELIKTFLGLDANKNVTANMSEEQKQSFARERLKKNADGLLEMIQKTEDLQEKFSKSLGATMMPGVAKQLMYQYVLDGRWKERFSELEKLISGREEGTPSNQENLIAKFGSLQGYEREIKAQEKKVESAQKKYDTAVQDVAKENDPTKSIMQNARMKKARRIQKQNAERILEREKATLKQMKENLESFKQTVAEGQVISAEEILKLNADERLRMLDDYYRKDYSEAQQKEIDKAKNLLIQDGTPLNIAMERVRDAAVLTHRIEDNMEVAKSIMNNPLEANMMQEALIENRRSSIMKYFNDKVVAEAMAKLLQDSETAVTEDKVVEHARNLSTAVLNSMFTNVQKELKSSPENRTLSDATLQNLSDGIEKILKERTEGRKNIVDLDSYLRKTEKVSHTEVKSEQRITTDRELSQNDKKLLDYAMDYAAERGKTTEDLEELVDTEDFRNYADERNHTTVPENRVTLPSSEYTKSLVKDVLEAFTKHKEETKKASEPIETTGTPESVATPPVEPKETKPRTEEVITTDNEKPASNDPLGIRSKDTGNTEGNTSEGTIMDKAHLYNEKLAGDVDSLVKEISKIAMPKELKQKVLDILSSLLEKQAYSDIAELRGELLGELAIVSREDYPSVDSVSQRIAEIKLDALTNNQTAASSASTGEGTENLFGTNAPTSNLLARDLEDLMKYPTMKKYIEDHNVQKFLQKYAEARVKEREKWTDNKEEGPLHQGLPLFIYDPALAQQVKEEIESNKLTYNPEILAPIIIALEINDTNKYLVEDEKQLLTIKDKTDNKEHKYQVLGFLPASQVADYESEAIKGTARTASILRGRINWSDNEAHVLRAEPSKDSGKYNGGILYGRQLQVNVPTKVEEIPHGTQETPKSDMRQLLEDNLMSETERLTDVTEEDIQKYKEAKEKGNPIAVRSTNFYKAMRALFLKRLKSSKRTNKDEDLGDIKELVFRVQKGTHNTFPKNVFIKKISETLDRNTGVHITELLKRVEKDGSGAEEVIASNSRLERLYEKLSTLPMPEGLFNQEGNIAISVSAYNNTLDKFANSVENIIADYLTVDKINVEVEISSGVPSEKTVSIKVYSGEQKAENLLSTLTTKYNGRVSEAEYALFLKDLILDSEGKTRPGLRDSRFERVKWQVRYDIDVLEDDSKTEDEKKAVKTNYERMFDDGIFEMQMTKLSYPATSVSLTLTDRTVQKLALKPAPATPAPKATEQHPVDTVEGKTGLVDADSGMQRGQHTDAPPAETKLQKAWDIINKIIEDSKTRIVEGNHYNIAGQIWSRVTSIKHAMEGVGERFNPNSGWALPSTRIGNSFDAFGRDVFNRVFESMSEADRQAAFEGYNNSTGKNYAECYTALKALEARLKAKHQTIVGIGDRENPGNITGRGTIDVVYKNGDKTESTKVRVAGTIDVLAVDDDGNLHIYDFKTSRESLTKDKAEKEGYDRQLSMYAQFLEDEYGLEVKSVNIIPIKADYPTPNGVQNNGEPIKNPRKDYREQRPGSNQLEVKDLTADDSHYEKFTGANFKVEREFEVTRLKGEQLQASLEKMTADEKAALVEAIQDQSDAPSNTVTSTDDIVGSQVEVKPEVKDTTYDNGEEELDNDLSFLSEDEEGGETVTEEQALEDIPSEEMGIQARIEQNKKDCGG